MSLPKKDQQQAEKDQAGMAAIRNVLLSWNREKDGPATPNKITSKAPYGRERTSNLLSKMLYEGTVKRSPITIKNNSTHEYGLAETPSGVSGVSDTDQIPGPMGVVGVPKGNRDTTTTSPALATFKTRTPDTDADDWGEV